MFQAVISASLIGLPRPGVSATAALAPNANASERANSALRVDMLDPSGTIDAPAVYAVVVLVGERQRVLHRRAGLAARGNELGTERLHRAGFIPGATLQDHRLAIPTPGHAEAGERLGQHRLLQCRLRPAFAAVGRDQDFGDASVARIGDAGNLVVARLLQRMDERGMGD